MGARIDHIKKLYEKFKESSASEADIDEFFELLQNPENLEILKERMGDDWTDQGVTHVSSPLEWQDVALVWKKKLATERKLMMARRNRRYRWAAAACVLVIIGLSLLVYMGFGNEEYQIYSTGFGQVEKVVLDDGSQVTLNANSQLKWKRDWMESGHRVVELRGEAFFKVASIHDATTGGKTGFDVRTEDLTIQVVGTSFNVKSRTAKTDVFLQEGQVVLDLLEKDQISGQRGNSDRIVMNPGESVSYSSVTRNLEKSESDQFGNASWMEGTFTFSNMPVTEVLQSLEEIYGITFVVEDQSIFDRKLTTNLPYSDWPIVQSGLELLLRAQLINKGNQIIISRK